MNDLHRRARRSGAGAIVAIAGLASLIAPAPGGARAQQDPQQRLWQGMEQQQSQQRSAPAPLREAVASRSPDSPLAAMVQPPEDRLQRQQLAVLDAVNRRDWFGADRLLREYLRMPRHSPAMSGFVAASRAAAAGELGPAVTGYEAVLEADPRFTRATLDLARTLYADNRVRDAREAFDRLRTQALPPEVTRHIDEYLLAIERRVRAQWSLSVSAVREDNVNSASTVVDPCALVLFDQCLANTPGDKLSDTGVYVEGSVSRWWPLAGHHGLLARGLVYGNHYARHDEFDNLVAAVYAGYQYASASAQVQVLPLLEVDLEGGREIYRAFGVRAAYTRPLGPRAQLEASLEYKARRFAPRFAASLEGDVRSASLFGQYVLPGGWLAFGHLMWRESEARETVFALREQVARVGINKSFADQASVSLAYGRREKRAEAANLVFGKRQRDHEDSLFLNVSVPRWGWQGLTPTLGYEYRNNRSSIPHAYNYEKHRLTLGVNAVF
ncbi:surface lipoprotein assembly modifier [Mitsuaria sp. GD03876]|uniref:surface lipoprotein assembly modifier n=1 Tax=Mitsuaria sp. GD03876 TaxID=2975399 RepID=UPI002446B43D|nr:surface lipoprotein assembly modifier [Mitsuaria sp. GD03876]MDH0865033.1 surface lipoprotein assembly modifier [Mitsuaria sp. GD03876]